MEHAPSRWMGSTRLLRPRPLSLGPLSQPLQLESPSWRRCIIPQSVLLTKNSRTRMLLIRTGPLREDVSASTAQLLLGVPRLIGTQALLPLSPGAPVEK